MVERWSKFWSKRVEVARLPEADQEQIGHTLNSTRASGRSGEGKPLDIEDIVRRLKEPHGRS